MEMRETYQVHKNNLSRAAAENYVAVVEIRVPKFQEQFNSRTLMTSMSDLLLQRIKRTIPSVSNLK